MSSSERHTVLKRNVKRTVSRESEQDGGRIVKRFHAPSAFARLLDGRRARREQDRLARLRSAGLRAPRPIEVRKRDGHWELVTEFIEGVTLRDVMHAGGPWPGGVQRVARRLGRELALAFARGLDHADLHPGNVLLDHAGRPWLIDAARCRIGPVPSAAHMRAVLLTLAAGTREHLTPLARGLFLSAFLRALDPRRARELGRRTPLALALEDEGRERRRAVLEERARRWLRESGAVHESEQCGVRSLVRRGATDVEPTRVLRVDDGATHAWLAAARLTMHGIACARPLRLTMSPSPAASFELDAAPAPFPASAKLTRRAWRALGTSLGALHDRALTWDALTPGTLTLDVKTARACWLPRVRLRALNVSPEGRRRALLPLVGEFSPRPSARAAFLSGYIAAQRHSTHESALLRSELTRG